MNRTDFNKQIQVYSVGPTADGYGGSTVAEVLVDTIWAKIEPLSAGATLKTAGIMVPDRTIVVTIRKNVVTISPDYLIKYRGRSYSIISGPVELDFDNRFIQFTAQEDAKN